MRTTTIEHLIYKPKKRLYKTPILFLHGAWHGAWCWDLWLNYFSSLGYETHAISLPGHGNSSMKKWHINLYTLNNYIETLTHHISLISPTPVVIGHSLGGAIVQKYLEKNQLPATVLLATIPTRGMFPMVLRLIRQYPKPILKGIFFLNSYYWINTPKLAKKIFFDDDTQIDAILFHQKLVRESTNLMPLLFPFAKSNPNKSPILVIGGERDNVFTIKEQKQTAQRYNADCIIIENQPHNLMMASRWKDIADIINKWFNVDLGVP